jgi:hypothetical protein
MSISRRTLITRGTFIGLTLGVPLLRLPFDSPASDSRTVAGLVFDRRFAAARHFADLASGSAPWVIGYDGDLTEVWRQKLRPLWAAGAGPVTGISTERGLICLTELAREHHHRVTATRPLADSGVSLFHWVVTDSRQPTGA